MRSYRVVCALSGGGAKAAAHIGALRAFEEFDLHPMHFVATSMGAVMAACFASGMKYEDVLERMLLVEPSDVAAWSPSLVKGPFATSLLDIGRLRDTIGTLVPARRFDELRVPLTVAAVDAENGQLALFGAGGRARVPLVDALTASCALPLYYAPVRIGDRLYVDGGLRAVLPLDVAMRLDPDLLFAVHVGPWLFDDPPARALNTPPLLAAHNRALRILMAGQVEDALARIRGMGVPLVFVKPRASQAATFDVAAAAHYVAEGYRSTVRAMHEWLGADLGSGLSGARLP